MSKKPCRALLRKRIAAIIDPYSYWRIPNTEENRRKEKAALLSLLSLLKKDQTIFRSLPYSTARKEFWYIVGLEPVFLDLTKKDYRNACNDLRDYNDMYLYTEEAKNALISLLEYFLPEISE